MSNKNATFPIVHVILLGGESVSVYYKPGFRPGTFQSVNNLTDEAYSNELFAKAKAVAAKQSLEEVTGQGHVPSVHKPSVYFSKGLFNKRISYTIECGQATLADSEMIREWRSKKELSSQKAIENANSYLAYLESGVRKAA